MVEICGDSLPHDHPRLTTLGCYVTTWQGKSDTGQTRADQGKSDMWWCAQGWAGVAGPVRVCIYMSACVHICADMSELSEIVGT